MLALRNLFNLTKIKQNNVALVKNTLFQRNLRGFPRQRVEFKVINKAEKDQSNETEAATQTENQQTTDGITANVVKEIALNKQPYYECVSTTTEDSHLPVEQGDEDSQLADVEVGKKDFVPTFNFAAYVNKSPTLQQFIKLGVDLHSIERRKGLPEFVLRLDFERDVKPYLFFLQDQGVLPDVFGTLITKNPLLFKIDLDDLQTRVQYLESKNFTLQERSRIFTVNPFWLMFSTRRIDRRLGHFQKEFHLSGADVRFLASKQPRLITYNMEHIRKSTFCIREEMGFDKDEIKCLLLSKPRLWMMESDALIERFAYAHQEMQLSHEMLIQVPEVLASREFRLRQRHEFLKLLGRAQYDPQNDMYVSPKAVVEGNDYHFVRNVAKTDMKTYELFLKTR